MKKTLLLSALLISSLSQLNAQCAITPGCSTATNGYCTTPAAATPLPNASELTPYNTVIQVSIGTSTVATIYDFTITSFTGLPAGLSYSTNPTNGVIPANSNGCILIAGTPTAGSAGSYTATANITANTNFGPFPSTATWPLTVTGGVGIKSYSIANMIIAPNPATSELIISADFHFAKIQIIDALGKIVISHDANYASQTIIDVHNLSKGVYFLQANDGSKLITRKFIKD
ncbi:MAG: T9SS type A sorting domain-containing protein [Burkholderiales bacterium]|nr:T9SS type A sorting domain-containing protein [Bacteroidia bacterium]